MPDSSLPDLPPDDLERIQETRAAFRLRALALLPEPGLPKPVLAGEARQAIADRLIEAAVELFTTGAQIYLRRATLPQVRAIIEELKDATVRDAEAVWRELGTRNVLERAVSVPLRPLPGSDGFGGSIVTIDRIDIKTMVERRLLTAANDIEREVLERFLEPTHQEAPSATAVTAGAAKMRVEPTDSAPNATAHDEAARRKRLLDDYKSATGNPPNKRIYEATNSSIHKPEFYRWLKGKLPAKSATAQNFERFLRENKPPTSKKPRD